MTDSKTGTAGCESMIERVARAICATYYGKPDRDGNWMAFLKEARAAIEAMQEPTDAMTEAGAGLDDDDWDDSPIGFASAKGEARATYRAMIATALNEVK